MTSAESVSLYIHIPFCRSRCRYCDFYSVAGPAATLVDRTVEKLLGDTESRLRQYPGTRVRTAFVGGGTPTLLSPETLFSLLDRLRAIDPDIEELTVEANPESLNQETLEALASGGADRLSLGAQTYDDRLLEWLGRPAGLEALERADRLIKELWKGRLSRDVLVGLPRIGSAETGSTDIERAIADKPGHLSVYDLTVEPGTPLAEAVRTGKDVLPDETARAAEWNSLQAILRERNYRRYEVSNFALPGEESRHNLGYWKMNPYLGIGPGAVSNLPDGFGGAIRRREVPDLEKWLDRGKDAIAEESITPGELALEHFMMGLRLAEGLSRERFSAVFGMDPVEIIPRTAQKGVDDGSLIVDAQALRPSLRGMDILDRILIDVASELDGLESFPPTRWPANRP